MTINLSKLRNFSNVSQLIANHVWSSNVPDGTNFFDIKPEDFELVDYDSC